MKSLVGLEELRAKDANLAKAWINTALLADADADLTTAEPGEEDDNDLLVLAKRPSFPPEHVWMPPLVQGARERLGRVINCFHVSGLEVRRSSWPRAGMAMRERLQIKAASLKLELRA